MMNFQIHIQKHKPKNFTINLTNIQEVKTTVQIKKNKVHKAQLNKISKSLPIV